MANTATVSESSGFMAYVERLDRRRGARRDRAAPLRAYVTGLLLPGERKSVEPMAARVDPRHVRARHQSMHHFVATAPWDETAVLAGARDYALAQLERHGPIAAWVVDDTAFPKKGTHSVGVARQYCGVVGKQDNCQVAVTVSAVNAIMSVPCAYRLYLPETWARDRARRQAAGVPDAVGFHRKWEIALSALTAVRAEDLPRAPVVADAGYGTTTAFREGILALGLSYAVGIAAETSVWAPGDGPAGPKRWTGRGRPPTQYRRTRTHQPWAARALAAAVASVGVADRALAGGDARDDAVAVRRRARPGSPSRRAQRPAAGAGVAADRVAARRARPHEVLAGDRPRGHAARGPRAAGQTPLAHRA